MILALAMFANITTAQDNSSDACTPDQAQEAIEFYDDNDLNGEYDAIAAGIQEILDTRAYSDISELLYDKVLFYSEYRRQVMSMDRCDLTRKLFDAYSLAYADRVMSIAILSAALEDSNNIDRWTDLLPNLDDQFTVNVLNVTLLYPIIEAIADE